MPRSRGPTPDNYDDLARRAVPLPDSSHRPTRLEEEVAKSRPQRDLATVDTRRGDAALGQAIVDALAGLHHADLADVHVRIDDRTAIVTGSVATARDRDEIVRALDAVRGGFSTIEQLRVRDA